MDEVLTMDSVLSCIVAATKVSLYSSHYVHVYIHIIYIYIYIYIHIYMVVQILVRTNSVLSSYELKPVRTQTTTCSTGMQVVRTKIWVRTNSVRTQILLHVVVRSSSCLYEGPNHLCNLQQELNDIAADLRAKAHTRIDCVMMVRALSLTKAPV